MVACWHRGFTLVETFIAIAIVSVLALLAIQGAQRSSAQVKKAGCAQNMRTIGGALISYAADNQQMLPFQASGEPHFTPMILATSLVGKNGDAGYLSWDGGPLRVWWSDVLLCPGDPNRRVYEARTSDVTPISYMYRQNGQAARGTESNPSVRLSLVSRPENQLGYKRWILADRHVLGPDGIVKPYAGLSVQLRASGGPYAKWSDRDTLSNSSYWHPNGANVLYEDGSVAFRVFGLDPLGR